MAVGAVTVVPQVGSVLALAYQRFVDSFVAQSRRSQLALVLVNTMLAYVWHADAGGHWPWLWLTLACSFSLWRHLRTEALVRTLDLNQSTRRIVLLLLGSGSVQALPLIQFAALGLEARGVLTLVLVTLATVSVITTSGFHGVFMAFSAPMVLSLALAWGIHGWQSGHAIGFALCGMLLLYLWFLHVTGKHASAVFLEGCAWRFGEQQLNEELKRALAEADEANRAKSQFLAAASHDLRQPIHSMNVLVAALSLRPLDGPTKEIVGLLGSVNQTLSKQLDTLLDVSKLDAGVVLAVPTLHQLDELVRTHHAATAPLAQQLGLTLQMHAPQPVWVQTDGALLLRALSNLTDNAIKYTPHGGTVRLEVLRDGTDALVRVQDTGIGIAAENQELVFREFYQVGNVERDRTKGLGLGLSIVRRLCRLLGVQLTMASAPGCGTQFTLRLPSVPVPEPDPSTCATTRETQGRSGLRVLVIDDEIMVRQSMYLLLQELGCTVHLADDVASAARVAEQHALDVVLSDLRLRDGASGIDAILAVRHHHAALPAVLITGDTAPDRIRDAKSAGVPVLFKPVTLEGLIGVMPQARSANLD